MASALTVHINLKNTKKLIKDWESRIDGTHPEDNIKIFLEEFMDEVRGAVLTKYINTYSQKQSNINRRTYLLEHTLDYSNVKQTSRFGFIGSATKPSMWPLGEGRPEYAIFQEFGTINITARNFLLQGDNYIKIFLQKRLSDRLRKWTISK